MLASTQSCSKAPLSREGGTQDTAPSLQEWETNKEECLQKGGQTKQAREMEGENEPLLKPALQSDHTAWCDLHSVSLISSVDFWEAPSTDSQKAISKETSMTLFAFCLHIGFLYEMTPEGFVLCDAPAQSLEEPEE